MKKPKNISQSEILTLVSSPYNAIQDKILGIYITIKLLQQQKIPLSTGLSPCITNNIVQTLHQQILHISFLG